LEWDQIVFQPDHFFDNHNLGEANITLHVDNCSGQNKNRFMMMYLAWRVLAQLNENIEVSFLLVGYTKFAPDWCFGLMKQVFCRTKLVAWMISSMLSTSQQQSTMHSL